MHHKQLNEGHEHPTPILRPNIVSEQPKSKLKDIHSGKKMKNKSP